MGTHRGCPRARGDAATVGSPAALDRGAVDVVSSVGTSAVAATSAALGRLEVREHRLTAEVAGAREELLRDLQIDLAADGRLGVDEASR